MQLLNSSFFVLDYGSNSLFIYMHIFDMQSSTRHNMIFTSFDFLRQRIFHTATCIPFSAMVLKSSTTSNNIDVSLQRGNPIEAWIYNSHPLSWTRFLTDEFIALSSRRGCSALMIHLPRQAAGIQSCGQLGFRRNLETVHSLHDKNWQRKAIMVAYPHRTDSIVASPLTVLDVLQNIAGSTTPGSQTCSILQENHGAIWFSVINGIIIFGGENDGNIHNDFELFILLEKIHARGVWRWKCFYDEAKKKLLLGIV